MPDDAKKESRTFPLARRESSNLQVRGPLGVWFFPLLNLLHFFVENVMGKSSSKSTGRLRVLEIVRDQSGRITEILERNVEE